MTVTHNEVPDVTLKMLIEAGVIKPGTKVYAATDSTTVGRINDDGSITLSVNGQAKVFPYPSGAARAIVNLSVNGWLFWRVLEDGVYIDLAKYKASYKKRGTNMD